MNKKKKKISINKQSNFSHSLDDASININNSSTPTFIMDVEEIKAIVNKIFTTLDDLEKRIRKLEEKVDGYSF